MVEKFLQAVKDLDLTEKLFQGFFGLEVEEHRITTDGKISRYPYPTEFGSRRTHPYLQSDFTDSMLELVTEPTKGGRETVKNLRMLQQIVQSYLHEDERIWPFSMPPHLDEDDLKFAHDDFTRPWFQDYRDYLEQKYGIEHEIIAGTHINYSLNEKLLKTLYEKIMYDKYENYAAFKNATYFKLAQNFVLYRWLFTYLYGASPLSENKYAPDELDYPVRSLRNSNLGYSNHPGEKITYESLESQADQLEKYVADGTFYSIHEFYGPVRMKGKGDDFKRILNEGVSYLEFRAFDLDPLSRAGVSDDTLDFLEIFLAYSICAPLPDDLPAALADADKKNQEMALGNPNERPEWLRKSVGPLINNMAAFAEAMNAPKKYTTAIIITAKRLKNVKLTLGSQLAARIEDDSLVTYGLKVANDRYLKQRTLAHPIQVLSDKYSDSVQQLIKEAIVMGIRVRMLSDHVELIVNEHHESFEPEAMLEFPRGVRDFIEGKFPEFTMDHQKD